MLDLLSRLQAATSFDAFMEEIWPRDLFNGIGDDDSLYEFVQKELDSVHGDQRTHRELSADPTFSTVLTVPTPFNVAARRYCLRHGLHHETYLLVCGSNITWLEHHQSRYGVDPPTGVAETRPQEVPQGGMVLGAAEAMEMEDPSQEPSQGGAVPKIAEAVERELSVSR